jgi:hypothetical protein
VHPPAHLHTSTVAFSRQKRIETDQWQLAAPDQSRLAVRRPTARGFPRRRRI